MIVHHGNFQAPAIFDARDDPGRQSARVIKGGRASIHLASAFIPNGSDSFVFAGLGQSDFHLRDLTEQHFAYQPFQLCAANR